jgi:PAS domain S-box-containing protein
VVPELLRNKVAIFAGLQRKARHLETLTRELDLASEAVIVSDGGGSIEFWNTGAAALYGWGRGEVLGKNLDQVLPTAFPVAAREVFSTLLSAGEWEGTVRRRNKEGQEITVALRKILERSGAGGAILEMGQDISAQLQAEEALRQSERLAAMGRLAGVIAHEINNPLEAIANALFLVRSHPSLKGEAQHFARIAEKEVARIQRITQRTLSFYRESHLLLTDYLMPGQTGTELARAAKNICPELPVILLSRVTELPKDMEYVDLFLSKGEGPQSMCEKVAAVLSANRKQESASR